MFDIFDTLIIPILAYDSDVWGSKTKIVSIYSTKFYYALYVVLSALRVQQVI